VVVMYRPWFGGVESVRRGGRDSRLASGGSAAAIGRYCCYSALFCTRRRRVWPVFRDDVTFEGKRPSGTGWFLSLRNRPLSRASVCGTSCLGKERVRKKMEVIIPGGIGDRPYPKKTLQRKNILRADGVAASLQRSVSVLGGLKDLKKKAARPDHQFADPARPD